MSDLSNAPSEDEDFGGGASVAEDVDAGTPANVEDEDDDLGDDLFGDDDDADQQPE